MDTSANSTYNTTENRILLPGTFHKVVLSFALNKQSKTKLLKDISHSSFFYDSG